MKGIIFFDRCNYLTWEGIKQYIDERVIELKANNFSDEQIFQIVFGSRKFKSSFCESKYFQKAMDYFQTKYQIMNSLQKTIK